MSDTLLTAASLVLVMIGLYLANNLRRQLQLKVVDRRLESYSRLWSILEVAGPWRGELGRDPMSLTERRELYDKMTSWYFGKGDGMLLKPVTRELYLNAKFNMICDDAELRLNPKLDDDQIAKNSAEPERDLWRGRLSMRQLSLLRAQMRNDLQVFGDPYQKGLGPEDRAFLREAGVRLNRRPWKASNTPIRRQFRERAGST